MSSLSWLDFSESERRKVLDVVSLFRDSGTVDELGVGSIRDGFSDLLFPGTSTLHTRAGYLIFVPWVYRLVEASESRSRDPWRAARWLEVRLIDELAGSEDNAGTIGIDARATLKTFPSTVYWAALGIYRLRLYRGSQAQYHRWVARRAGRKVRVLLDDEGEAVDESAGAWHPGPEPPQGFPSGASFRLDAGVGAYLQQRLTSAARDSSGRETLLAYMLAEGIDGRDNPVPWHLARDRRLPDHLRRWLEHAGRFSVAIHGAPLLYNLMLAEKVGNGERREAFEERLASWAAEVTAEVGLDGWRRDEFWEAVGQSPARVTPLTRRFVDRWLDLTLADDPRALAGDRRARALIRERERRVKGGRARLVNPAALRLWGGDAGTARLDYRWGYVRQIVGDVLDSQRVGDRDA